MKKFYLLGGMAVATALIAAATTFPTSFPGQTGEAVYADGETTVGLPTPYYSFAAVSSSQFAAGWDVINANEDVKTWLPTSDYSSPCGFCANSGYTASNGVSQDDYLIAPAVHLEGGKTYKICYTWKAGSSFDKENFAVYVSMSKDPDEIKAATKLSEYLNFAQTSYKKDVTEFTPETEGDYYVAFYCFSEKFKTGVKIADLLIAEDKFAPSGVTGLKAIPGANHELSCELTWTLPTTDTFGGDIPEDKPITAVKVYRDGKEIEGVNLDGTATSFTDNAEFGLASGYHTYGVSVIADGVEGARTQVGPTTYIGSVEPFSLPAEFKISSQDEYDMWTVIKDKPNDTEAINRKWRFYDDSSYGPCALFNYEYEKYMTSDNWLITPPIKAESAGYYRITVTAFSTDSNSFEVCLLNSTDPESAIKTVVKNDWQIGKSTINDKPKQITTFDFKLKEIGDFYVGLHNTTSLKSNTWAKIYVSSIIVEKTSFIPCPIENLKAEPAADYANAIEVSWQNPTKSLTGDEILPSDYQIEIYLNESKTPAAIVDGDQTSTSVNVDKAGVYTVTVKTVATDSDHGTAPNHPSVTTSWVGSHEVEVPYETTFTQEDPTVKIWEIVDGNKDGVTFSHYAQSSWSHYMELKSSKEFNDYLLSPHMKLTPGFYMATVEQSGSSSTAASPVIGVIKANTFDVENIQMLSSAEINLNKLSVTTDLVFEVTEEGLYQIVYGLNQTFASNYSNLGVKKLTVKATEVFPGNVTDLTATITGDSNDSVELTWTNPSVYYNSEIVLPAIGEVVILRDSEEIHTISDNLTPGETASYVDTDVPVGPHTYSVKVLDAEGNAHEGTFPFVTLDWVGGGQTAPIDIVNGEFSLWSTEDLDGVHNDVNGNYKWSQKASYYEISGYNNTNDDYLISSPIKIKDNEVYQITFFMAPPMDGNNTDVNLAVKMGALTDEVTAYQKMHTIVVPASAGYANYSFYVSIVTEEKGEFEDDSNGIMMLADETLTPADYYNMAAKVPTSGDYRIALHHTDKGGLRVKEFHMAKIADYITTEIAEVGATKVTFDGQDVKFGGVAAVQVYNLAGVCVAAEGAAEGSFNVSKLGAGYYLVKVVTATETVTLKVTVK